MEEEEESGNINEKNCVGGLCLSKGFSIHNIPYIIFNTEQFSVQTSVLYVMSFDSAPKWL